MPFTSFVQAISNADYQFVYAAIVWLSAILIAGLAFRRFMHET